MKLLFAVLISAALPATLSAGLLAAINTQTGATFSTVDFFDPSSLTPVSSFNGAGLLEGLTFGAGYDVYTSSGNTIYHYDQAGTLLASATFGKTDIVELSYFNGALYAATNSGATSQILTLDPGTLGTLSSFDASGLNLLSGVSGSTLGIYVTGNGGIALFDNSGNLIDSGPSANFGPVSAVPDAVFSSIDNGEGYLFFGISPDLSEGFPYASTPGPPGVAAIDFAHVFFTDGNVVAMVLPIEPTYSSYFGTETDNFGNLALSPTPEPGTFVLMGLAGAALLAYRRRTA